MRSTRAQDIRDFVAARLAGMHFLAKAYAKLLSMKIGLQEEPQPSDQ